MLEVTDGTAPYHKAMDIGRKCLVGMISILVNATFR